MWRKVGWSKACQRVFEIDVVWRGTVQKCHNGWVTWVVKMNSWIAPGQTMRWILLVFEFGSKSKDTKPPSGLDRMLNWFCTADILGLCTMESWYKLGSRRSSFEWGSVPLIHKVRKMSTPGSSPNVYALLSWGALYRRVVENVVSGLSPNQAWTLSLNETRRIPVPSQRV